LIDSVNKEKIMARKSSNSQKYRKPTGMILIGGLRTIALKIIEKIIAC